MIKHLSFRSVILHEGVCFYVLAWVLIIVAAIGIILLKPRKPKVTLVFPRELAKRIENSLPHDAIKLYQSWLLMSLDKCYQILQKKHSKEALSDLAKILADKLVFIFNRVPKTSLYKILEERNKDNAFVALIFFTTVIKALKPYAVKSIFKKPVSAYCDVFTYITLDNAPQFLFREHYRLYELGALVGGLWSSLNFNSDIEPFLRSVLEPQLLEDKRQSTQKSSAAVANESTVIESKAATPESQEESLCEQEDQKPPIAQEAVAEATPQNSVNTDSIEIERCDKFFKWLQRQINRKPINTDEYFYQDFKQYGKSTIFLTEFALADFSKKTQISSDEVVEALVLLNHSDRKAYQLKVEGHPGKTLLAVVVDFETKASSELGGTIEEVL